MVKHKEEDRLAAVKAVEAGASIASTARQFQISESVIRRSYGLYQQHGVKGLSNSKHAWTTEEKYQILKYMHDNYLSCQETGIKFGISGSDTVWLWEQKYLENGIEGLENKKKSRKPRVQKPKPPKTREEELLDRIQYLEAENAYLKKLNALVAEREKRERGNG